MNRKFNWSLPGEKSRIINKFDAITILGAGENAKKILFWLKDILNSKEIIILDNDTSKAGEKIKFFDFTYEIQNTEIYFSHKRFLNNDIFLISPEQKYQEIEEQILSYNSGLDILCWARREYSMGDYFERRIIDPIISIESRFDLFVRDKRELRYEIMENKKIIIPQVILVLGNICNLQCKKCSMLMPYMPNRYNVSVEEAMEETDIFLEAVDEVVSFNLVAGETLIYPGISEIISYLCSKDKVKLVTMATNSYGELSKKTLDALSNPKVLVLMSDYGQIAQLGNRVAIFEKHGIKFKVVNEQKWIDFGDMSKKGKSQEELAWAYTRCFEGDICHTLFDRKLWACERAARMYMLDESHKFSSDYIDLYEEDLREKIRDFLLIRTAYACNFCNACSEDTELIDAGEQINGTIIRSNYTLIKRS